MENHSLLDGFYDHWSSVTYYTTWVKWRIISTTNVKILTTQLLDLLVSQTNPAQVTKLTIEPVIKIFFWIVQSVGHCHLYGRNVQMFCIISFIFYVKFVLIIFLKFVECREDTSVFKLTLELFRNACPNCFFFKWHIAKLLNHKNDK